MQARQAPSAQSPPRPPHPAAASAARVPAQGHQLCQGHLLVPVPTLASSPAPDPQIPWVVLPWAPLPFCARSSFLTLSQNTSLCSRPEPRAAQPQNKPSSDHPSNRGVLCWLTGTGGVAEQSLGERSHIPQLSTGSPWGWRCSSQGWGLHYPQDPPPPHPKSEATETPPAPLPGPGAVGGQGGSIRAVAAPEGGSSLFYPGCNGAGLAGQRRILYSSGSRPTSPFPAPVTAGARSKDTPLSPVPRGLGTHRQGAGGKDGFASLSSTAQHHREGWHWTRWHPKTIPWGWPG